MCIRERCGCAGGGKGLLIQEDKSGTIATANDQFLVFHLLQDPISSDSIAPCLTRGNEHGEASLGVVAFDRATYNMGENAQFSPGIDETGKAFTVIAKGPGGGMLCNEHNR